jgi:phosphohistidine phosphatase SixA
VQRRRRLPRIEPAVALDGLRGWEHLDFDPARAELLERTRIRPQLPVGARAEKQTLGQLVEHVVEILEHETVPFLAPPAAHHALRQHDDVARLLTSVDRHAPEAVALDLGHRLDRTAVAIETHETRARPLAASVAQVGREIELRRHTDADGDVLTPEGVAAALKIGARLVGGYQLAISTGAQRATQTLACFLATLGQQVPGGVVVEPGLRSRVEDRWRTAYQKAGSGELGTLREADAALVADDSKRLGAALRRVLDGLPDAGRALVVGHSPTNEAAVLGLTGEIIAPLAKGAGVLVVAGDDGYQVEPLD